MLRFILRIFSKKRKEKLFKKSYSQDGEDMILNSFFDDFGGRNNGFYIDIGALHPFRFSNTAFFYEGGWHGINIEPTPTAIDLFKVHRERDVNLNIGIGEKHEVLQFYCFDEPALNSFSKTLSEDRDQNTNYNIIEVKEIAVYPLSEILDQFLPVGQHIDFMSIDVEGLDIQVLKSNNWDKYVPEFIFAEDIIDFKCLNQSEVYNYLVERGYDLVAKTHRTMIFKLIKNVSI